MVKNSKNISDLKAQILVQPQLEEISSRALQKTEATAFNFEFTKSMMVSAYHQSSSSLKDLNIQCRFKGSSSLWTLNRLKFNKKANDEYFKLTISLGSFISLSSSPEIMIHQRHLAKIDRILFAETNVLSRKELVEYLNSIVAPQTQQVQRWNIERCF